MGDNFSGAKEVLGFTAPTVEAFLGRNTISLPRRLRISGQQNPGLGRWRHSDTGILCQLFHERPPNKIPEARKANASPLNHLEEAQALLLNLPDHSHHRVSPTKHREKSQSNRKDIKMASELRSYGLRCEPRIVIKGQVFADFIADFTSRTMEHANQLGGWILNVDGASNSKGVGIGIVLTTPEGSIIEQSFTLGFHASNNEAEYEVVLAGLRAAITLEVTGLEVHCDSSLIVNQVSGEYVTRD